VILWHLLAPRTPMLYHARNLVLLALAAGLLYLTMARLTRSRLACLLPVLFFVVCKMQLVTIGYGAAIDSVISLVEALSAVLLLLVFFQKGSHVALVGSYAMLALTVGRGIPGSC